MGWRELIKVHPAADLFPMMSDAELAELAADIKKNGVRVPIELYYEADAAGCWVLDGRNRLDAMELAGYRFVASEKGAPEVTNPDGKAIYLDWRYYRARAGFDPYSCVVSLNINRRHLTTEMKRDIIAALLKANPERSDRETGKMAKADGKTVANVREKLEARAEVPHVATRTDSKGRKQPAKKVKAAPKNLTSHSETTSESRPRGKIPLDDPNRPRNRGKPFVVPAAESTAWAAAAAVNRKDEPAAIVVQPTSLDCAITAAIALTREDFRRFRAWAIAYRAEEFDRTGGLDIERLAKILALLSSDKEGEVINAARKLDEMCAASGTDVVTLAHRLVAASRPTTQELFRDGFRGGDGSVGEDHDAPESFAERADRERRRMEEELVKLQAEVITVSRPDLFNEHVRQMNEDWELRRKEQKAEDSEKRREAKRRKKLQEEAEQRRMEADKKYRTSPEYEALRPLQREIDKIRAEIKRHRDERFGEMRENLAAAD